MGYCDATPGPFVRRCGNRHGGLCKKADRGLDAFGMAVGALDVDDAARRLLALRRMRSA